MTKNKKDIVEKQGPIMGLFDDSHFMNVFDMLSYWNNFIDRAWNDRSLSGDAFYALQPKGNLPKINVAETDDSYEIEIATSGINKDDLELEFKDSCLLIKADKTKEEETEDKKWLRREISSRSFRRAIKFPAKIESSSIASNYDEKKGIVVVTLPKIKKEEPDVVKIKID